MSKFKTRYDHCNPVSPHGGVSMTDQQYLKECDINVILKRYAVTGNVPVSRAGISGDFSNIGDFYDCLDKITRAKAEFDALPSHIRDRFGGDPTAYVDFVLNPSNTDECVKLGLKVRALPADTATDVLHRIEKAVTRNGAGQSNHERPIAPATT